MREFCTLKIPRYGLMLMMACASIARFFSENLIYDVLIIAGVMYSFQGFAVLHAAVVNKGRKNTYLLPAYLLVAPQIVLVGFSVLGGFDIFVDFRKAPKQFHD